MKYQCAHETSEFIPCIIVPIYIFCNLKYQRVSISMYRAIMAQTRDICAKAI